MSKLHKNNTNAFKLDLLQLQRYANRWANKYSVIQIERIILYRHYSESAEVFGIKAEGCFGVKTESIKYALVFEISGYTHKNLMEIDLGTMPTDDDDECTTALKEIVFANLLIPHPLFDPSFADEVYDDEPSIDYLRNWTFRLKLPGDSSEPNIRTDEPFWVLYDIEADKHLEKEDLVKEASADAFIRSLRFYFESDNEIKIHASYKPKKSYSCETIGFRNNTTEQWKTFIKILQDPPHTFYLNPDKQRRRIAEINKKLTNFFCTYPDFSLQLPEDYKIYEEFSKEINKKYRFKFQIISEVKGSLESKYALFSQDKIIDEFHKLVEK